MGMRRIRSAGVAVARRDVFLDADPSRKGARGQFQRLLALARQQGAALAIGLPRGAPTLAALAQGLPRLEQLEIGLVPASKLRALENIRIRTLPVILAVSSVVISPLFQLGLGGGGRRSKHAVNSSMPPMVSPTHPHPPFLRCQLKDGANHFSSVATPVT